MPPLAFAASFKYLVSLPPSLDPGGAFASNTYTQVLSGILNSRSNQSSSLRGISLDRNGNIYTAGTILLPSGIGLSDSLVTKSRNDGTPVWQKRTGTACEDSFFDVACDTLGNVYTIGTELGSLPQATDPGTVSVDVLINATGDGTVLRKFNTDGALVWSVKTITGLGFGIAVTATAVYQTNQSSIVKYTLDGAVVWSMILYISAPQVGSAKRLRPAVDTDGNAYVVSHATCTGSQRSVSYLTKLTASGSMAWANLMIPTLTVGYTRRLDVAVDSENNVVVVGDYSANTGSRFLHIEKFNSAGAIIWHKIVYAAFVLNVHTDDLNAAELSIDTSNNIYVVGTHAIGLSQNSSAFILKLDTLGNLVWQKHLSKPGTETQGFGVCVDTDYLYVCGQITSTSSYITELYSIKVPVDGSKSGMLVGFDYINSTFTCADSSTRTDVANVFNSQYYNSQYWTVLASGPLSAGYFTTTNSVVRDLPLNSTIHLGTSFSLDNFRAGRSHVFSDGSMVVSGTKSTADCLISKLTADGDEQWRIGRAFDGYSRPYIYCLYGDTDGNTYAIYADPAAGAAGDYPFYVQKISPAGAIVWVSRSTYYYNGMARNSTFKVSNKSISVDSSGNVYVIMTYRDSQYVPCDTCMYVKYSQAGTILISGVVGGYWNSGNGCVFGPIHLIDGVLTFGEYQYILTADYNTGLLNLYKLLSSDRSTIWHRCVANIIDSSATGNVNSIAMDSTGNVHLATSISDTVTIANRYPAVIVKYGPDGSMLWERVIYVKDLNISVRGMDVDSVGNLYISTVLGIVVYDASGTLLKTAELDAYGQLQIVGTDIYIKSSLGVSKYAISVLSELAEFTFSDAYRARVFTSPVTAFPQTIYNGSRFDTSTLPTVPVITGSAPEKTLLMLGCSAAVDQTLSAPHIGGSSWFYNWSGLLSPTTDYDVQAANTLYASAAAAIPSLKWFDVWSVSSPSTTIDAIVANPTLYTGVQPADIQWYSAFAGYDVSVSQSTNNATLQAV